MNTIAWHARLEWITQGSHNTSVQSIAKQLVDKVAEGVTDNEKDELQQLLLKYSGILSQYEGDLGRTDLVYHHIVTGDHKGIKQSGRRLPFHQREEVKELLDGMLERQVIEPSQGSWSSPVVLVKKKDGSKILCGLQTVKCCDQEGCTTPISYLALTKHWMSWGLHGGSPALTLQADTGRLRWHLKIVRKRHLLLHMVYFSSVSCLLVLQMLLPLFSV